MKRNYGIILATTAALAIAWGPAAGSFLKDLDKLKNNIGKGLEQGVGDIIKEGEKGIGNLGKVGEKALHDLGKNAEKALHDTGRTLEDAGQFVKEHPFETAIAVVFVAGGTYLIIYQGYTLGLTVGGKTVASYTYAQMAGAAGVAAGAGTAVATAAADEGKKKQQVAATEPAPKVNSANTNKEGPPFLPEKATDRDRLILGVEAIQWAKENDPVEKFDPKAYPNSSSPGEKVLIESLLELQTVPDSAADKAAKEQAKQRDDFVTDQFKKALQDLASGKIPDPVNAAKEALIESLKPTLVGDGQSAAREILKQQVTDELYEYAVKRDPCIRTPVAKGCLKEPLSGPVIQKSKL